MEHEAAAAGHEAGSGFPPFDQIGQFGTSQIFWLIVTFAALYAFVAFVFLPRITAAIESRDGAIKADVAKAAELSANADASVRRFEAQIAEARARARETAAQAKAVADARSAAETAKVEADLSLRLGAAETRIKETRARAMASVSGLAEEAAAAISEKLTGVKAAPDLVKKAVAGAVRG